MKYVVEHLDEEVGKWTCLEYAHMRKIVGDDLLITNVSEADKKLMPQDLPTDPRRCGNIGLDPQRVCLLDLQGDGDLSPEDADKFDAVVFGGILGDHPPRDRTGCLRRLGFVKKKLGPRQMSTDTAMLVCKKILEEGKRLDEIPYDDDPEVKTGDKDMTLLPYRYVVDEKTGETLITPGLPELLAEDEEW